jgi:hypothetical protein
VRQGKGLRDPDDGAASVGEVLSVDNVALGDLHVLVERGGQVEAPDALGWALAEESLQHRHVCRRLRGVGTERVDQRVLLKGGGTVFGRLLGSGHVVLPPCELKLTKSPVNAEGA